MGCVCVRDRGTSLERQITKDIDDHLRDEKGAIPRTHRILLLGPGESGKSTIIKQMIKVHRGNIPTDTLQWSVAKIKREVAHMIITLCRASIDLNIELVKTDDNQDIESIRDRMCEFKVASAADITPDIVTQMKLLWTNDGIKRTLQQRHKFQIADHVSYWYNLRLDDIYLSDSYLPTFDDYLRLRLRSTGCIEETFSVLIGDSSDQHLLTFVDVGGQRCERRKWFNMMKDNISSVVYIIAISEYDMMCFEDNKTPRMTEALRLFETVLQKGFMDGRFKTVTLFFNKYDLLLEKLNDNSNESFRNYYEDFPIDKDDRNPTHVCEFIFDKFKTVFQKWKNDFEVNIHYHCTTAMDTNQIQNVVDDIVKDILQRLGNKMQSFS